VAATGGVAIIPRMAGPTARKRSEPRRRGGVSERAWRTFDWIVPAEHAEGLVYGVIAVGTLLAAEGGAHDSYADAFGSAIIAALVYWLARSYAMLLGRRLTSDDQLTVRTMMGALAHERTVLRGALVPLLALVLAWLSGADKEEGINVALASTIATIIVFEVAAGVHSRSTRREIALELGVGVLLGLAIIALKTLLHH